MNYLLHLAVPKAACGSFHGGGLLETLEPPHDAMAMENAVHLSPFLCTSSTLLAPARYLGEIATLGNPQKESKRCFFSLSQLSPDLPKSLFLFLFSPRMMVVKGEGGEGDDEDNGDAVCVCSETRGFSFSSLSSALLQSGRRKI